jgi:hypothetical protein
MPSEGHSFDFGGLVIPLKAKIAFGHLSKKCSQEEHGDVQL